MLCTSTACACKVRGIPTNPRTMINRPTSVYRIIPITNQCVSVISPLLASAFVLPSEFAVSVALDCTRTVPMTQVVIIQPLVS